MLKHLPAEAAEPHAFVNLEQTTDRDKSKDANRLSERGVRCTTCQKLFVSTSHTEHCNNSIFTNL